jgi:hypothetical protein
MYTPKSHLPHPNVRALSVLCLLAENFRTVSTTQLLTCITALDNVSAITYDKDPGVKVVVIQIDVSSLGQRCSSSEQQGKGEDEQIRPYRRSASHV